MTYQSTVTGDSPSAYYRLGDASGPTVTATVGNNLTANNSPTFGVTGLLTGDSDKAMTFVAASSQNATGSDSGLPTGNGAWSIEAWVKTSQTGEVVFVNWGTAGSARDVAFGMLNGVLTFDTSSFFNQFGSATVNNNVRHQVALTWDGTTMKAYIDGSQVGSGYAPGALNVTLGGTLRVASRSGIYYYDGTMDEVSIYPSALTSGQIGAHWTAGSTASANGTASPTRATASWTARAPSASGTTGTSYPAAVTADSPVAYWRLGESSGTTAVATVGPDGTYQNTPTLGVAGLVPGNTAITLDRTQTESVRIPTGMPAGSATGYSVEMWVNLPAVTVNGQEQTLWSQGAFGGAGFHELRYRFFTANEYVLYWSFYDGAVQTVILRDVNGNYLGGGAHHLVVTHDYAAKSAKFYLDGSLVTTTSLAAYGTPATLASGLSSRIGGYMGNDLTMTSGTFDEVAIYTSVLSAARVGAHYAAISAGPNGTASPVRAQATWTARTPNSVVGTGTSYFISPTGNDSTGNGSIGSPWKTIAKFATVADAGDTLFCRGGTYTGVTRTTITGSPSGAPGQPITVRNYPGETPVFQGPGAASIAQFLHIRDGASYWTVDGLTMQNFKTGSSGVIYIGDGRTTPLASTHHNIVRNCTFFNFYEGTGPFNHSVYLSAFADDCIVENNVMHGAQVAGSDGCAVNCGDHEPSPQRFLIQRNVMENFGGAGAIWINGNITNGSVLHNTFGTNVIHISLRFYQTGGVTVRDNAGVNATSIAIYDAPGEGTGAVVDHNYWGQTLDANWHLVSGDTAIGGASDGSDAGAFPFSTSANGTASPSRATITWTPRTPVPKGNATRAVTRATAGWIIRTPVPASAVSVTASPSRATLQWFVRGTVQTGLPTSVSSRGLLLRGVAGSRAGAVEVFSIGVVAKGYDEPFDLGSTSLRALAVTEPFYLSGDAFGRAVERFDIGGFASATVVEQFAILGRKHLAHDDGSIARPQIGWFNPRDNVAPEAEVLV